jgi:hypothetical protein
MARAITYFDKARSVAAALMIAAGAAAIIGSILDWVDITPPPTVPETDLARTQPYSGIDAGDGWWIVALAVILISCALALAITRRRGWARLAFIACIVMGGIAIAGVRAVGELDSGITQRMDVVGDPDPALGVLLVAAAAVLGFLGAVIGLAASPPEPEVT